MLAEQGDMSNMNTNNNKIFNVIEMKVGRYTVWNWRGRGGLDFREPTQDL